MRRNFFFSPPASNARRLGPADGRARSLPRARPALPGRAARASASETRRRASSRRPSRGRSLSLASHERDAFRVRVPPPTHRRHAAPHAQHARLERQGARPPRPPRRTRLSKPRVATGFIPPDRRLASNPPPSSGRSSPPQGPANGFPLNRGFGEGGARRTSTRFLVNSSRRSTGPRSRPRRRASASTVSERAPEDPSADEPFLRAFHHALMEVRQGGVPHLPGQREAVSHRRASETCSSARTRSESIR